MDEVQTNKKKTALLIASYAAPAKKAECEEHLQELALLADTYGLETLGSAPCLLRKMEAATFFSSGKIEELIELSNQLNVDLVIVDDEISPAQQRNLEALFKKTVMDRTEVILGVFGARAQTKEARLQIELAKSKYALPRLKRLWTHLSRQHGSGGSGSGGGYQKGEGEKQLEIDKRIEKRKIDQLQKEIEEVKAVRQTQRSQRERKEVPTFAIVGYTNAGKSTLLNAMTDAKVFVEDKLFATLDTTTRKFMLPNNQEILLIDTVGFIRKLPTLLVAAFKSTLEESTQADILLHLIDVNNPAAEEQAETTLGVLKQLGAEETPVITVLNKVDLCPASPMLQRLRVKYPKNVAISALDKTGFDELLEIMMREIKALRHSVTLKIPQSDYHIVSEVIRQGTVHKQDYEENDVIIYVDLPKTLAGKLRKYAIEL